MNLSLKNRVAASFIVANLVVLILSFTVFHFLNGLNKEMDQITAKSNKISLLTDEIRISAVLILKNQRKILTKKSTPETIEKIIELCDSFTNQLHNLETLYNDPEVKKVVIKMLSYVDSLKLVLSNAALFHRDTMGMSSIAELADKILDAFSEFQDIQYFQSVERDKKIKDIVEETKKNMMITLIIGFLGTIILGLIIPGKIALPFKKIKDAIRELQECNFDVSIYYNQRDEIGEIAQEMNRMIQSVELFDELRTDRINVENRKFDALANLVKKPVMVANAEGRLIYMNNRLYSLMQLQMTDVIGKNIHDTVIPKSIIEAYEKAIKRRSKIENHEVVIPLRKNVAVEDEEAKVVDIVEVESDNQKTLTEVVFKGFGYVIPIRGKESNLDYYLMVLSEEIFS
ncbi:MAG: HAMP domain-containing protein [Bacteriovoracaceae bacterium]